MMCLLSATKPFSQDRPECPFRLSPGSGRFSRDFPARRSAAGIPELPPRVLHHPGLLPSGLPRPSYRKLYVQHLATDYEAVSCGSDATDRRFTKCYGTLGSRPAVAEPQFPSSRLVSLDVGLSARSGRGNRGYGRHRGERRIVAGVGDTS